MTEGRTIAIGDVHGCSAALAALVRAIDPTPLDTLVFLGDYIDRGPDSRGVLEQMIALAERCMVVPLLGNHEEMLLAALEGPSELRYWLKFGGREALASYGYRGGPEIRPADLRALIPVEHLQFIKGCRDYFETVRHTFVHAYYEPDRPLHEQSWSGLRQDMVADVRVGLDRLNTVARKILGRNTAAPPSEADLERPDLWQRLWQDLWQKLWQVVVVSSP